MRRRSVGEARVEAAVEADHERRAGLLHDAQAGARALGIEADRLLAEDRLAGAGAPFDQIGMRVGRRADDERVDIRRLDDGVDLGDLGPGRLGEAARRLAAGIGHGSEPRARMQGDVAAVDAPDPAGSEDADAQLVPVHRPSLLDDPPIGQRMKHRCHRHAIGDLVPSRRSGLSAWTRIGTGHSSTARSRW